MQKTICDRCGAECVNKYLNLYGSVIHTTNKSEDCGSDDFRTVQLCGHCQEALAQFLGPAYQLVPAERERAIEARDAPMPISVWMDDPDGLRRVEASGAAAGRALG